jgi:hypothetical protein
MICHSKIWCTRTERRISIAHERAELVAGSRSENGTELDGIEYGGAMVLTGDKTSGKLLHYWLQAPIIGTTASQYGFATLRPCPSVAGGMV